MRFHGLMAIRDEIDILPEITDHLLSWLDALYIYDTGSIDGTWEWLNDQAAKDDPRIVLLERKDAFFFDQHRAWIFEQARPNMESGDWFARLDADEFFDILPPAFIEQHLRPWDTVIYQNKYDFQFTTDDLQRWQSGQETLDSRSVPISERRLRYRPQPFAEPRLFRFRKRLRWSPDRFDPYLRGVVAERKIPIRHYPHRDPAQIAYRIKLRRIVRRYRDSMNDTGGMHWDLDEDWTKIVVPAGDPSLETHTPGDPICPNIQAMPTEPAHKRALRILAYATVVPLYLDRAKQRPFPHGWNPPLMPPDFADMLRREHLASLETARSLGAGQPGHQTSTPGSPKADTT